MDKSSSWWPQHHQWLDSGADVRYWTSANENWYQTRIQQLRDSHYSVRQGREWLNSLRFFKGTNRFVKRNEQNSSTFINSLTL